ncbi:hypothetical protein [Salinigranum rubrum]|nr:hypothetical protein [Salinigranum rubrum]
MHADPAPDTHRIAVRRHLEQALVESNDPETRFHIRQALQLTV